MLTQSTAADFDQAFSRLAVLTDLKSFIDKLGWMPQEIEAVNEAYMMLSAGESVDDTIAVLNSGWRYSAIRELRKVVEDPKMPVANIIPILDSMKPR